ncbi:MAG: hypothetical protein JSS83_10930 [Cyanobacteria bacterium SZAS LIN-3]|nr:hypothetical protein [Cyanobacteria bacterium SZAS LIN-3]MBS2006024.1 hypothetical protein [Cyanobacteria bacterium SZAS TMP-1]
MRLPFNKHFAYTCIVRPVAKVIIWLPLASVLLLAGGPLALIVSFLIFLAIVGNLIFSFPKSPLEKSRLTNLIARQGYDNRAPIMPFSINGQKRDRFQKP